MTIEQRVAILIDWYNRPELRAIASVDVKHFIDHVNGDVQ
jgi:hypothetical protein